MLEMKREEDTAMKINTIKQFIIDAFKSLRRNKTISFASVITVGATLFIFGVFMLLALTINMGVQSIEDTVEVKIFLKDNIDLVQKRDLELELKKFEGVKDYKYESKFEALKNFKEQLKDKKGLLDSFDSSNNPMPAAFIVKLDKVEDAEKVQSEFKGKTGVEDIGNQKEVIDRIIQISNTVKWIGIVVFLILAGVSLFLIANTIKLTVFSRRREIGIMKFVGATDWFIRWPFIIEGIVIGIFGAIVSNIALYFLYDMLYTKIVMQLMTVSLVSPHYVLSAMLGEFILAGILVGALGSFLSLRKFLDV